MEGIAYRRDDIAGWTLRAHHNAGEYASRVAACRRQAYANVGLSRQNALALLVERRRLAGNVRCAGLHRLAVRNARRTDELLPARMRRAQRESLARGFSSKGGDHRDRL